MSTAVEGVPSDLVHADVQAGTVTLRVDASLYPRSALYGAAYVFLDRCFVLLDKPDPDHFRVTLSWKKPDPGEDTLRSLVGEFANELLSCAWRAAIAEENRAVIEAATAQALAGAMGPPSLDDLEKFDFTEQPFEDPLGIALSWEEKYGKKKQADGAKDSKDPAG
jgi:His-Xaa-Ser system protein HxsD